MRVLVIRPEPDATKTAALLTERGHRTLVAPVLETEFLGVELPEAADLVVLTSGNAARALAARPDAQHLMSLPVVAVGATTAAVARDAGFGLVMSADGRAADVAATVAALDLPEGTLVFYPAAETRADALEARLSALGLRVALAAIYRTVPVATWPQSVVEAVAAGNIDVVQVMSQRSGAALAALVARHGIEAAVRRISVHAIAQEVVAPDLAAAFGSVTIAATPSLAGLLACLDGRSGDRPSNMR